MANKKSIIIISDSDAGVAAAVQARQYDENARIILVRELDFFLWPQPTIEQYLLGDNNGLDELLLDGDEQLTKRHNIKIMRNARSVALDIDSRSILLEYRGKKERYLFDSLIFCGRLQSKKLDDKVVADVKIVSLHTSEDIQTIRDIVQKKDASALVIGGDNEAIDAALTLKNAGIKVTMIDHKHRLMPEFSLQFSLATLAHLSRQGITTKLGVTVTTVTSDSSGGVVVTLCNDEQIHTDVVITCLGFVPNNALLAHAGAALDPDGLIRVDDHLATTLPHIYACGSAIAVPLAITGERRLLLRQSIMKKTAQIAGYNAAIDEAPRKLKPLIKTTLIPIGETLFGGTGLTESAACEYFGHDRVCVTTSFTALNENSGLWVKLVVERTKQQVIGAEIYGESDVLQHLDVVTLAILESFSLDRLMDLDFASLDYFKRATDPIVDAAERAKRALCEDNKVLSAELLALWLKDGRDFCLVDVEHESLLNRKNVLHVPLENLRDRMGEIFSKHIPIVLCSLSGHKSYQAMRVLSLRGFDAYYLDGGVTTLNLVTSQE